MAMRRLLFTATLLLLGACASKPAEDLGYSGAKRTYLDANLGMTLTLPADWQRRSIVPADGSLGDYSVLWSAPGGRNAAKLLVSLLPPGNLTDTASRELERFSSTHPGFTLIARSLGQFGNWTMESAIGHVPSTNYRVLHIDTGRHIYQLAFAAPPEKFQLLEPLFDEILESFQPLE